MQEIVFEKHIEEHDPSYGSLTPMENFGSRVGSRRASIIGTPVVDAPLDIQTY